MFDVERSMFDVESFNVYKWYSVKEGVSPRSVYKSGVYHLIAGKISGALF